MTVKRGLSGGKDLGELQLRLLGGVSLSRGGRPLVGGASQRRNLAVLAILAASAPSGVTRERLAAILWPESDEGGARNSLKQSIHVLRRELGEDAILGVTDVRLGLGAASCDLIRFEESLARGALAEVVDAYRGPFLDGFHLGRDAGDFSRWVEETRVQLERRCRKALQTLAESALARGAHDEAVEWWQKAAAIAPLESRYVHGIVAARLAMGDRSGAIHAGERHRALLRAEFGVALPAELERLITRARTPQAEARDADAAVMQVDVSASEVGTRPDTAAITGQNSSPGGAGSSDFPSVLVALRSQPPARSLRMAVGVALVVVSVLGVSRLVRTGLTTHDPTDARRVAVSLVRDAGGIDASGAARRIAEVAVSHLSASPLADPVLLPAGPGVSATEQALRAGAALVVSIRSDRMGASATLIDAKSGRVLWGGSVIESSGGSGQEAVDAFAERTATAVLLQQDRSTRSWIHRASRPSKLESYTAFVQGLRVVSMMPQPEHRMKEYFVTAARDTGFTLAAAFAALARGLDGERAAADSIFNALRTRALPPLDAAFVEWAIAFIDDNSVVEFRGARAISEAAPNTEWSFLQARAAINVGRAREALRVLDALGPDSGWTRGSDQYWLQRDRALHYLGEYESEVREMEEAQRRFPEFRLFIQSRVKGLAALGREREVNEELDRAFTLTTTSEMEGQPMSQAMDELASHGHHAAASRLAARLLDWLQRQPPEVQQRRVLFKLDLLIQLGRFREARELALGVAAKDAIDVYHGAQLSLAYADAALGDLSTARRIAARANRQQWLNTLYRADMLALMGDSAGAVALLRDAFRENGDIRPIVHLYYGLRRLRGYAAYDQLLRPDDW